MPATGMVYLHQPSPPPPPNPNPNPPLPLPPPLPPQTSAFSMSSSEAGRLNRSSFLRRLFSRGRLRASSGPHSGAAGETYDDDDADTMVMMPSPHTHPLLSKPYARDEFQLRRRRPRAPKSAFTGLDSSTARKLSIPKLTGGFEYSGSSFSINLTAQGDMYRRSLREREIAAMAAATDRRYVQEWGFFIKCYSEGRFNLSNPPDPPPRRPEFNHLIAPLPPNERQRLKAVRACNITLSAAAHEKCHRLVLLARKVFQTRMACISLIDESLEIIKAEHSFGRKYLSRGDSIATHVLLTNEPMVVLDTVKDWRFRGSPLTQDAPHLRFYAGAPITNFDGQTIGVFAVFDTQPRSAFPAASRRNLMDFARLAMTEFEMVMEEHDVMKQHMPTKIVGQTKVADSDTDSIASRRGRLSAKLLKGIEENAEKMPPVSPILAGEASEVILDSPTVPTMPQDSFVARPREASQGSLVLPPPESPTWFSDEEPRQYKVMDNPPPRTSSRAPPPPHVGVAPSSTGYANATPITPRYKQHRPLPIVPAPHLPNARHLISPAPSTPSTPRIPTSPGSITSMVEATYATSLIARSLDYDFVYLLRVSSCAAEYSPLVPIEPYREKTAISTRVLVAHGLPSPPPIFDAGLHLRALRTVGGLIFQNPAQEDSGEDDVGYQLGILLPLARDCGDGVGGSDEGYYSPGATENCVGGIVLAAFARKASIQPAFRADEVRFLREFGEAMRDILVKADRSLKMGSRV